MMYPYMTLADETEIVHSQIVEKDGMKKVIVNFERAGVNTGKQTYFYDAMGEPKHSWITNWYLTDLFGETKLWNPSVVLSTAAILIYTVIALGGAVR